MLVREQLYVEANFLSFFFIVFNCDATVHFYVFFKFELFVEKFHSLEKHLIFLLTGGLIIKKGVFHTFMSYVMNVI